MSNPFHRIATALVALAGIAALPAPVAADPLLSKAQIADAARQIEACLNGELSSVQITTPQQCVGRIQGKCDDEISAGGEAAHATCADNETAAWDAVLNGTWAQLKASLPAEVFAKLQEVQRAWLPYRDKKCAFVHILDDSMMGYMNAAQCRLDETSRRAIELRELLGG